MVKVMVHAEDEEYMMIVQGHANFAQTNDIVCSAVSAIVQSLICYIDNTDGPTQKEIDVKGGNVKIHVCGNIEEAYKMAVLGLESLAETYPDHVKIM